MRENEIKVLKSVNDQLEKQCQSIIELKRKVNNVDKMKTKEDNLIN